MPAVLFDYVRRKKAEAEVDRRVVELALATAVYLPSHCGLAINVHASTFGRDQGFADFVASQAQRTGMDLSRITIEIVEQSPAWCQGNFLANLEHLRAIGIKIALDDVGTGYSNYRMILDVHPDIFKLDGYLVNGIDRDLDRMAVAKSLVSLARDFGSEIIAEAVETEPQFISLAQVGISLFQGYLFYRPMPLPQLLEEIERKQTAESGAVSPAFRLESFLTTPAA